MVLCIVIGVLHCILSLVFVLLCVQVTGDGSVDCANDPAEQETIVSQLIFCEVISGVGLLSTAGSMVIKMFTLFEHSSICLMYLLCCLFKQVCTLADTYFSRYVP